MLEIAYVSTTLYARPIPMPESMELEYVMSSTYNTVAFTWNNSFVGEKKHYKRTMIQKHTHTQLCTTVVS